MRLFVGVLLGTMVVMTTLIDDSEGWWLSRGRASSRSRPEEDSDMGPRVVEEEPRSLLEEILAERLATMDSEDRDPEDNISEDRETDGKVPEDWDPEDNIPEGVGPQAVPVQYMGCYTDTYTRKFPSRVMTTSNSMTNAWCANYCKGKDFPYSATQYSYECFCGTEAEFKNLGQKLIPDTQCSKPCRGDGNEKCGGAWKMSVSRILDEPRWQEVSGRLKYVAVGPSGVWGVNSKDEIYYRTGTYGDVTAQGSGWEKTDGLLKQISSGNDIVWGVNSNDDIYIRQGISEKSPTGAKWQHISGKLEQVHVSSTKDEYEVWGVNSIDNIFRRTGITSEKPAGTDWKQIEGALKCVSVGQAGVWGVNKKDQIYYRTGITSQNQDGTGWKHVDGGLTQITSGHDEVWGVNRANEIYVRRGITAAKPTGENWERIPGGLKEVYVSNRNHVWGVNKGDKIYQWST